MSRQLRRSALLLLSLIACGKAPTSAPAVGKTAPALASPAGTALPAGLTPTAASSAVPAAAPLPAETTLVQSPVGAVDLSDTLTPTDLAPVGLADAPWLLDRAAAWLRARAGGGSPSGTQHWSRRGPHGTVIDAMSWTSEGFTLQTLGSDLSYRLDARGCSAHLREHEATCDPELARSVRLAAALTGLTWPDLPGRTAWYAENMRSNTADRGVELRLALPKARLRVTETVRIDGTVTRIELPTAGLRLEPTADGFAVADRGQPVWTWSRLEGRPPPAERAVLRMSNLAGASPDVEQWQKAARQRGFSILTPPEVQVDVRDDALRLVWVQAHVIGKPEAAAVFGAQVIASSPPPLDRVVTWKSKNFMAEVAHLPPGCHIVQPLGESLAAGASGEVTVVLRLCP